MVTETQVDLFGDMMRAQQGWLSLWFGWCAPAAFNMDPHVSAGIAADAFNRAESYARIGQDMAVAMFAPVAN